MLPRVCLFTDSLDPSGLGAHMLTLAAELRGRAHISFVCPPGPAGLPLLDRAQDLGLATLALEVRGAASARAALGAWLGAHDVDIFHCHAGIGWEGHAGVRAARAADVPIVVRTEHLPYLLTDPDERDEYKDLIPAVDRFICVSEEVRESFARAGVPARKLSTVYNGIAPRPPRHGRDETRARLGVGPRDPVVLTIGRFTPQKGHAYLCRAVPSIVARVPTARFFWAGRGPLEGDLRDLVSRLGLEREIHLLGQRDDVPDLLAAADLVVMPSLFEGMPLVALEAMAAGVPLVATRVCGSTEVVRDGVTGRLVRPGDVGALADAVIEALVNPELAERWGKNARLRRESDFGAASMASEAHAIYTDLLSRSRPREDRVAPSLAEAGVAGA